MYFTNYRSVPGKYFEEVVNYPIVEPTSVVQFTPPSQTLNMSSRAAAHSFITFVVSGNNDSLVTIVSNGDVQNAVSGLNNSFEFQYTLFSDSSSGSRFLTENYSSTFTTGNPALWSVSEILSNLLVREDDASFSPPDGSTIAFPNPFSYANGNIENINFSFNGKNGEKVDFAVYSTSMNLVHSSEHFVGPLVNNSLGLIWDVRGNDGEKLPSGVYIYVIQKGDEIIKGKVVIFN